MNWPPYDVPGVQSITYYLRCPECGEVYDEEIDFCLDRECTRELEEVTHKEAYSLE